MRVAFLGLGIMGRPMASNLVKAGHEVSVWNRTRGQGYRGRAYARLHPQMRQKARKWSGCAYRTPRRWRVCYSGLKGVEESLTDGMTIVDSSTISPSATRQFAERVGARGVRYVDAPMTGSKVAAEAGSLIFIVGGDEASD